ncbi:queuosine salvage family protein [Micromonospora sp. WMMD1076]|uniref:queuosine salvage family protein n=1 Tax=Micromonospora sp. WMMD1076 TaxID=3016103 RepID=UPI00249BCECC|nr:queuosine salvage family protein [Micromonospora sp. WMMD1076]WFF06193.1 queuosine salvage family protein [Micromonospora sp. WMMD1076]
MTDQTTGVAAAPRTYPDHPAALRVAAATVAARAAHVRPSSRPVDAGYLDELRRRPPVESGLSRLPDERTRIGFVIVRDAINFGSGLHPHLVKLPGLSGARTIGQHLLDRVLRQGVPDPAYLAGLDAHACAELFGQPTRGPAFTLMTMFATAWNELGAYTRDRFGGEYPALVEEAAGSPTRMVAVLAGMPHWRDVSHHGDLAVPFHKRAQLATYGLSLCHDPGGTRRFADLGRLTAFADNLIPHVLIEDGLLEVSAELADALRAGRPLEHGSAPEVELRAGAVEVCERLARRAAADGDPLHPVELASLLWKRGQQPRYKATPRPRSVSFAY